MFDIVITILAGSWHIFEESSVYILIGFLAAGMLKAFVPLATVEKRLGGNGIGAVTRAALWGIPLPLCSCSVLPTAMALRKMGAGKGATSAFLISTPESGVDSISLSFALLDPVMAIFRPFAAFITAMTAGTLENIFGDRKNNDIKMEIAPDGCGSCECHTCEEKAAPGFAGKIRDGVRFAFVDLLDDLVWWLLFGIALAGAITVLVPDDFFHALFGAGYLAMPAMLLIGIPMYICASASTPLAAAMILKGLSPGAALVFLLSGPATNLGSLVVIRRFMGVRSMTLYLLSIAICSLALGFALDGVYAAMGVDPIAVMGKGGELFPPCVEKLGALIFGLLVARSIIAKSGMANGWLMWRG